MFVWGGGDILETICVEVFCLRRLGFSGTLCLDLDFVDHMCGWGF